MLRNRSVSEALMLILTGNSQPLLLPDAIERRLAKAVFRVITASRSQLAETRQRIEPYRSGYVNSLQFVAKFSCIGHCIRVIAPCIR